MFVRNTALALAAIFATVGISADAEARTGASLSAIKEVKRDLKEIKKDRAQLARGRAAGDLAAAARDQKELKKDSRNSRRTDGA